MPELRPHHDPAGVMATPPSPRTALFWDGTYWLPATVDAGGRLQVRGEDQLFSFLGVLAESRSVAISGAGGYVDSDPCAAGEIWCVTGACSTDRTSATTRHEYGLFHDAAYTPRQQIGAAFAALDMACWEGWVWLDPSDTIRVYFAGGLVGDTCDVHITGYRMTLEV